MWCSNCGSQDHLSGKCPKPRPQKKIEPAVYIPNGDLREIKRLEDEVKRLEEENKALRLEEENKALRLEQRNCTACGGPIDEHGICFECDRPACPVCETRRRKETLRKRKQRAVS